MTEIQITLFLEALTPQQLSMLTAQAQMQWGMKLTFFDFSQTKKGTFICWYNVPHGIWVEKVANGVA